MLLHSIAYSQQSPTKKEVGSEPYPAPVMYGNITMEQAKFIKLFEDKDVSNLHVYASPQMGAKNNYFAGTAISSAYSNYFRGSVAKQTLVQGQEPHAVFSMRGEAEELYLVRMPGDRFSHEVNLYGWNNGKMEQRQRLAYYECKRNRCVQMDSWIQDVNGDTRLDLIQVKKTVRANGQKVRIDKAVYLMDQRGFFKKSKDTSVNFDNYKLQEMEGEPAKTGKL